MKLSGHLTLCIESDPGVFPRPSTLWLYGIEQPVSAPVTINTSLMPSEPVVAILHGQQLAALYVIAERDHTPIQVAGATDLLLDLHRLTDHTASACRILARVRTLHEAAFHSLSIRDMLAFQRLLERWEQRTTRDALAYRASWQECIALCRARWRDDGLDTCLGDLSMLDEAEEPKAAQRIPIQLTGYELALDQMS